MSRILGIDWGTVRVGLAIGDEQQRIALPYDVIANDDAIIGTLRRIIETEEVYRMVIGIPLTMAGDHAWKAQQVDRFIDTLKQHFTIPILTEDERLSSKMVDQLFGEYRGKYDRDAIAAMVILQGYLDKIH